MRQKKWETRLLNRIIAPIMRRKWTILNLIDMEVIHVRGYFKWPSQVTLQSQFHFITVSSHMQKNNFFHSKLHLTIHTVFVQRHWRKFPSGIPVTVSYNDEMYSRWDTVILIESPATLCVLQKKQSPYKANECGSPSRRVSLEKPSVTVQCHKMIAHWDKRRYCRELAANPREKCSKSKRLYIEEVYLTFPKMLTSKL